MVTGNLVTGSSAGQTLFMTVNVVLDYTRSSAFSQFQVFGHVEFCTGCIHAAPFMSHAQCVHELCAVCVSVCECASMYVGGGLRITIYPRCLSTLLWIFMQSNTCCTTA